MRHDALYTETLRETGASSDLRPEQIEIVRGAVYVDPVIALSIKGDLNVDRHGCPTLVD